MSNKKKIHLAQFLVHGPTYHSLAMWRHPKSELDNYAWAKPDLYQHIAQTCERGKFDMVFFADLNYISDTYKGTLDPALRYAVQAPEHDPIPLLSYMAAVTNHIGLGATLSVSHHHPFYLARLWATLDHLTGGRAAWNVVTSVNDNQAANYGEKREPTDQRYEKADEFIEVCRQLWNSWDEDAVVMDRANAVFADPTKVHRIEFEGEFYKSRGPLNVIRTPQNGPALIQAGTSPKGRAIAAKHADAIFAIQPHARDADLVDAGLQLLDDSAELEHAPVNELVPEEGGMAILSAHLNFDMSKLPPETEMASRDEPELQRMKPRYIRPEGGSFTASEIARRHGQSVSLPQFVGTVESIVDQMEAWVDEVGGDGFMLSPIYCPGAIEEFVDQVVPELQRRGIYRYDYTGTTQRDHLLQYN